MRLNRVPDFLHSTAGRANAAAVVLLFAASLPVLAVDGTVINKTTGLPVSYTHLDVYKRQLHGAAPPGRA